MGEPGARRRERAALFFFSLRSPYSYLAYRDLIDRYADVVPHLRWIPFWEPDDESVALLEAAGGRFIYSPMSKAKDLYVLRDVKRLATDRGLALAWPIDKKPWWEVPHLAYLVADRSGRGPEFIAAAYRARWEQGRDICDPATIADIAGSLDLDPRRLCEAVRDRELRRGAALDALLAVYRNGVFGVPFFVHGHDQYWGVDRLHRFVAAVRAEHVDAAQPADFPADPALTRTGTDDGHAGGCG